MQKDFVDTHASVVEWGESLVTGNVKENGIPVAHFALLFTSEVCFLACLRTLMI